MRYCILSLVSLILSCFTLFGQTDKFPLKYRVTAAPSLQSGIKYSYNKGSNGYYAHEIIPAGGIKRGPFTALFGYPIVHGYRPKSADETELAIGTEIKDDQGKWSVRENDMESIQPGIFATFQYSPSRWFIQPHIGGSIGYQGGYGPFWSAESGVTVYITPEIGVAVDYGYKKYFSWENEGHTISFSLCFYI